MSKISSLVLIGVVAILVLDIVGSIASNHFEFHYANLWPLSLLIYAIIAFVATRSLNLLTGTLIAALLGLVEATIGWKISIMLNAYGMKDAVAEQTTIIFITTIILAMFIGALIGLIAGAISRIKLPC